MYLYGKSLYRPYIVGIYGLTWASLEVRPSKKKKELKQKPSFRKTAMQLQMLEDAKHDEKIYK